MRIRIIIDDQDAADAPESPFTLNVYRDDDDGTQSRIPLGDEAVIGADVPAMLRDLAARWEADPSGYEHPASEYERPADEPEPGPCANCGKRIEPDDGGAIWYHADTRAYFCDGNDQRDRSWGEVLMHATPQDAIKPFELGATQ